MKLEAITTTDTTNFPVKQFFLTACRWISDPSIYESMPTGGAPWRLPRARLSELDVRRMLEAGHVASTDPAAVLGSVLVFPVDEVSKKRRRCIKHTKDINDHFGRDTLQKVCLPSRSEQSLQSRSGKFALTLDFAAYFDQFELHPAISQRMCFEAHGSTLCLRRMPMGQRQAVEVAQGATNVLLSFELPADVSVQSCIDNVRFVGPTAASVIAAARAFVARCRRAGCTINDLPDVGSPEADHQALAKMVHQQGEWLGAEYDYSRAKQRVAQKSIDKLGVSWAHADGWSMKDYAAHLGLLFFATSVLRLNVGRHFETMKRYRLRSAAAAHDPSLWRERVAMEMAEAADLDAWTREAITNAWVPCHDGRPPALILVTDASDWGWGALCLDTDSGLVDSCSVPWTRADRERLDVSKSSYAEPEAVYRALCRFVRPAENRPVAVYTDSTTAQWSLPKGYSPSFVVNAIAAKCRDAFPAVQLITHHVKGSENVVDPLSRGNTLPESAAIAMQRVVRR